jgi:exonuclease I
MEQPRRRILPQYIDLTNHIVRPREQSCVYCKCRDHTIMDCNSPSLTRIINQMCREVGVSRAYFQNFLCRQSRITLRAMVARIMRHSFSTLRKSDYITMFILYFDQFFKSEN